jgi:hypothetical protein
MRRMRPILSYFGVAVRPNETFALISIVAGCVVPALIGIALVHPLPPYHMNFVGTFWAVSGCSTGGGVVAAVAGIMSRRCNPSLCIVGLVLNVTQVVLLTCF